MKWLKRKLRTWALKDDCDSVPIEVAVRSNSIDSNGFHFRVFKANGGIVIETENYDRQKDRHNRSLHVIVEGKDLGEEIGKIITYENLKL